MEPTLSQLAFSLEENDKLRLQLLQSFCILLEHSTIIKLNIDVLESDDVSTDLGKFMRNIHHWVTELLKIEKDPSQELQLLKLAQTLFAVCPYAMMKPHLTRVVTDWVVVELTKPEMDTFKRNQLLRTLGVSFGQV